ncbi:MAG: peptide chain release factor N(5)-glutamine methyltransferase [Dehalococcoidia bacterium]|nr:peptide chain release factor N(5)-glutamine methyltransferase [Dehalococcoidia bacterium]
MQHLNKRLTEAGIDDARQEAFIILQHVTRQSATALYADLQRPITIAETEAINATVSRRLQHEPLQYILNCAYFYGREYHVDSRVLIPRPETELLIDLLLKVLPAKEENSPLWVADVGTGSGAIAVALASEIPQARVLAIDISEGALQVARNNATRSGVSSSVYLVRSDLLNGIRPELDAIVANLPYIASADIASLSPEIAQCEPRAALDGGADGLDLIRRLSAQATVMLRQGAWLLLEVGAGQAAAVSDMLSDTQCWDSVTTTSDLGGIPRVISAHKAVSASLESGKPATKPPAR